MCILKHKARICFCTQIQGVRHKSEPARNVDINNLYCESAGSKAQVLVAS